MADQTKGLWKTTIHIWTDFDPQGIALPRLAQEADDGAGFCDYSHVEYIQHPESYSPAAVEFFYPDEEEDEHDGRCGTPGCPTCG